MAALGQDQSAWCLTVFADTAQEAMKQNKTDDYDVSNAYPHWRPFFAMTGVSCHTGEVVILWIVVMIFTRSMFANTT